MTKENAIKAQSALAGIATIAVTALVGLTASGSNLDWEAGDFTKFNAAGQSIAHNGFLSLDLLPYIILVGAVMYILGRVFGIFKFGSGSKTK